METIQNQAKPVKTKRERNECIIDDIVVNHSKEVSKKMLAWYAVFAELDCDTDSEEQFLLAIKAIDDAHDDMIESGFYQGLRKKVGIV